MATVILRPTSATSTSWSNISNAYDGNTSTSATVATTSSNYTSRVGTFTFDTSTIPSGSTINSATLYVNCKSSNNNRTKLYADINGNSSSRVINATIGTTQSNKTADITSYMSGLNTIQLMQYNNSTTSYTFTLHEIYIDVDYTEGSSRSNMGTRTYTFSKGYNIEEGTIVNSGSSYDNTIIEKVSVTPGTTYTFTLNTGTNFLAINNYAEDGVSVTSDILYEDWDITQKTFKITVPDNITQIRLYAYGESNYTGDLYGYIPSAGTAPVINIQSQNVTKISRVAGYDQCIVTFIADQELTYWEARATTSSQTPAHGVGLLVESGTLAEGETGYIYVDDEELTNGDLQYRIDIYGKNSSGVWSDD